MAAIDVGFPAIITQSQITGKKAGISVNYTVTRFRRQGQPPLIILTDAASLGRLLILLLYYCIIRYYAALTLDHAGHSFPKGRKGELKGQNSPVARHLYSTGILLKEKLDD
jgi:hypothetical protein